MKRYSSAGITNIFGTPVMYEDEKGRYVLASEARAEIERLRGLVFEAFVEGRGDGWTSDQDERAWNFSHSKSVLDKT